MEKAKKTVCVHVQTQILNQSENSAEFLTNLLQLYKNEFVAAGGSAQVVESYTVQNFRRMLRNNFPEDELPVEDDSIKKIVVWNSGTMMFDRASSLAKMIEESHYSAIYECAKLLRNDILGQQVRQLEEPFTVEKVMAVEIEAPESVKEFFSILYAGGNRKITKSAPGRLKFSGCSLWVLWRYFIARQTSRTGSCCEINVRQ